MFSIAEDNHRIWSAQRRQRGLCVFTLLMAAILAGCTPPDSERSKALSSALTVVSYGGGAYQKSHETSFCEPFHLYTGVKVDSITWNAEYGKLKSMVTSGKVPWDVVEVTAAQFKRGSTDGLFADLSVKPTEGEFLPGSIEDQGVANVYWGTVLACRKDAFTKGLPRTWADFFDVQNFPGPRALYDDPRGNLEFALLADGVELSGLYPLDVDRAFRKLESIKKDVRVWWKDGTQPVQLLLTHEVVLASAWNGRIFASQEAKEDIAYSWEGAALEIDYWVVPRGSANVDLASRFIAFASSPSALAKQAALVGYGPVNVSALDFIPASVRQQLPTFKENWDVSFVVDAEWWAENEETTKTRWLAWKMQ